MPSPDAFSLSRRQAGVLLLISTTAACTGDAGRPEPRPGPSAPRPAPADAGLRSRARASEQALIALHEAVATAHPGLAARISPLTEQHRRHLEALGEPATAATPSPAVPAPASSPAATGQAAALASLRRAESAASSALLLGLAAASPELRPLLASVAASEAAHAELLRAASR